MRLIQSTVLFSILYLTACSSADHLVRYNGIDNGVVRFEIKNQTDKDILGIDVEVTYLSSDSSVIVVDTVTYTSRKPDGTEDVFLKANSSTPIVQKVPEGTSKAKARVLSVRP